VSDYKITRVVVICFACIDMDHLSSDSNAEEGFLLTNQLSDETMTRNW